MAHACRGFPQFAHGAFVLFQVGWSYPHFMDAFQMKERVQDAQT